ncbi:hypothetical protein PALB_32600 [Pseudoalteromonas luteoviolacea B = ATCC 29581]|nr:hypothetical protein PALB_32600 [Pseudoalteromonas luteoviolacea B = ATCC 29581]
MDFEYQLRLSKRRKTVSIRVHRGQVKVYAPYGVDRASLEQWLASKSGWVHEKVEQTKDLELDIEKQLEQVWLWGKPYKLALCKQENTTKACETSQTFSIAKEHEARISEIIDRYLIESLQERLALRLNYWLQEMNMTVESVKIRRYKSRWGSCDRKGRLTFNSLLACFPMHLLDYVIVHELAHRTHLNHSAAFWRLVALHYPEHKLARHELKGWAKRIAF